MHPIIRRRLARLVLGAAALVATACDQQPPTATREEHAPAAEPIGRIGAQPKRAQLERLARRVARAMADSAFRSSVKAELDHSPVVEHKLHFQRFLHGTDRRGLRRLAQLNGETESQVDEDVMAAVALEMYFPVPSHRAAWRGGDDILVATTIGDRDTPVAYDVRGRRHLLRADRPPATPVLAVVPAEPNFDRPAPSAVIACGQMRVSAACAPVEGPTPAPPPPTGLYMTKVLLRESFESWLKGDPEIEVLVLGQKGATDSLTRYQCAGQRAIGSYYFDQNATNWSGNVLLFSQTQLDNYKAQHPGQSIRLFFMEDDDTSCELRNSNTSIQNLIGTVDGITRGLSGGRDSTSGLQRIYKYALAAQKLYSVVASFINSNDDMIGNAVASATIGEYSTGYNWVLKGEKGQTNGYINLLMR
jgi:hypothetical protein